MDIQLHSILSTTVSDLKGKKKKKKGMYLSTIYKILHSCAQNKFPNKNLNVKFIEIFFNSAICGFKKANHSSKKQQKQLQQILRMRGLLTSIVYCPLMCVLCQHQDI